MSLFLFVFFLLYTLMHVYAFSRARAALSFGITAGLLLAFFMLLMIATPILVRALERAGLEAPARAAAYIGYTWLGLLFLFSSYSICIDVYRAALYAAGYLAHKDSSAFMPSARAVFLVPFLLSVTTSVYGYFEALDIRPERIVIQTAKLPAGIDRLRIVQISDVHLGLIVRQERLKRIMDIVKAAKPDVFVSTGDLVDGDVYEMDGLSDLLREVNPRFGKYAVTGNHEFFAGIGQATLFIEKSGFRLLRGERVEGTINVAGVDDPAGRSLGLGRPVDEKELLSELPRDTFTLFLKHRPLVDPEAKGLFDLQLSGHVHKGQIFPFTVLTWLYYPVLSGLADEGNHSFLYVSRGTGTWGPPIRFLAPPEVTVIDVVRAGSPAS
ncbi:MAG: metallophosphoesterase [Nitrospiraceae bacterium]|nr:metallophosphoesterase [Nitrospiraceae bacterium]